ncbi:UNVERIFIED_CONTAM: hypothetical protein Cloal_2380 [Acetivibrio alkalicellulosi]
MKKKPIILISILIILIIGGVFLGNAIKNKKYVISAQVSYGEGINTHDFFAIDGYKKISIVVTNRTADSIIEVSLVNPDEKVVDEQVLKSDLMVFEKESLELMEGNWKVNVEAVENDASYSIEFILHN